jgi:hypothetical protein
MCQMIIQIKLIKKICSYDPILEPKYQFDLTFLLCSFDPPSPKKNESAVWPFVIYELKLLLTEKGHSCYRFQNRVSNEQSWKKRIKLTVLHIKKGSSNVPQINCCQIWAIAGHMPLSVFFSPLFQNPLHEYSSVVCQLLYSNPKWHLWRLYWILQWSTN